MKNKTFGGIPWNYADAEGAKIFLQSIPYDGTSTWGKGADRGFNAFLEAAENMELYDIETNTEVYKQGIHILDAAPDFENPEQMYEYTFSNTKSLLGTGRFLTFFGGEHSISIGIMEAFNNYFKDLTILQLDAHADLRPSYQGTPYNHACALHAANKRGHVIQVGIRSMNIEEKSAMNFKQVFFAHAIKKNEHWVEEVLTKMTNNVYITLDLDVFDSSVMPATGTPEPGGMDWFMINDFLQKIFKNKNVVGFDIVELAPIKGLHAPQYLVAKLYYKMLSYKFLNK